ncbi:MAG: PilZ domain-containing protein [Deltaproteobacteria bacterium]|nr:PilZ domain-containing protein [Deltaproteobacteria bacterium]
MAIDVSSRNVLLLHDGELAEVRALVEAVGARAIEAREPPGDEVEIAVVLATARHLRDVHRAGSGARVVRIAVLDHDARTLRALCRRAGVDLVLRRPVHPVAVRLLLLHALYRGPDRRARRVPVGVPVRFRVTLRSHPALLADLSTRGCQLVGCQPLAPGRRVTVYLPDPVTPSRSFTVAGRVVRAVRDGDPGFAVEFQGVSERVRERLRESVGAYSDGPAACDSREVAAAWRRFAPPPTPVDPPEDEPGISSVAPAGWPVPDAALAGSAGAGSAPAAPAPAGADERRREPRRTYEGRRVVALDDEAARVLVGHDLSPGGMRVAPNPALFVGQRLRVALYGSPGETPLVLDVEVARDDGERGLVLGFGAVADATHRHLAKLLDALPILDTGRPSAPGLVVSEILDAEPC